MGRARVGSIQRRRGAWVARVKYTDAHGRVVDLQRRAKNKTHAGELRDKLLREITLREQRAESNAGQAERDGQQIDVRTVDDLCDHYADEYAKAPEFTEDGKSLEEGMRSFKTVRGYLTVIRAHLGPRSLRSLTFGDLRRLRSRFKKTATNRGADRSHAHVNRVLSTFRAMLKIAVRERWMDSNPFDDGKGLISPGKENQRERTLSRAEESRLLAACDAPKRRHLRPLLICALDTGMRRGEILKLKWCDVDLKSRSIYVNATNTKTLTARSVPISARLGEELLVLALARVSLDERVFGINTVKTAFLAACRDAAVTDFRLHDARHTAATRMIEGGMQVVEVARILGHKEIRTSYRYMNSSSDTVQRAADVVDRLNLAAADQGEAPAVVN